MCSERVSNSPLEALTRNASSANSAKLAVLGTVGVISIEAIGWKVLDDVAFNLHSAYLFLEILLDGCGDLWLLRAPEVMCPPATLAYPSF